MGNKIRKINYYSKQSRKSSHRDSKAPKKYQKPHTTHKIKF
uniref:Uncharacterized protein n=1 Tax=Rhizophora mucronata TaxID=61149 RepID=A0A2P2IN76_RHIMU